MLPKALWASGRLGKAGPGDCNVGCDEPRIVFAQVREDAAIELAVLRSCPPDETVFCIGSGGCTALSLLAARPAQLQIVDINAAQVHLIELKIAALAHLSLRDMLRCILHNAEGYYQDLRPYLGGNCQRFWDGHPSLLAMGLNNCGVIEVRLRQLMRFLFLVQNRRNMRQLFTAKTLSKQQVVYRELWDNWRWRLAFKTILCKPLLRLVYGQAMLAALPADFSDQAKARFDSTIDRFLLAENGYLWQTLLGKYPKNENGWPAYLQAENYDAVQLGLGNTTVGCVDAAEWLDGQPANSIGFFALSNILEITTPAYAAHLLCAVVRAAKPGAKVCLRSILPFNDNLLQTTPELAPLPSAHLQQLDRSFFCTNLRVLRVDK